MLLRTRFTAYSRGEAAYVLATQAPKPGQEGDIKASAQKLRYSALTLLADSGTSEGADASTLRFTYEVAVVGQAGFGARAQGRARVSETSCFVRDAGGVWRYTSSPEQTTEDLPPLQS